MRRKSKAAYSLLQNGDLRRITTKPDGGQYVQHCSRQNFEVVATEFDESRKGLTMTEIVERLELPFTQVNVAVEFLKERGVVVAGHRRKSVPASACCLEGAFAEYFALAHKP